MKVFNFFLIINLLGLLGVGYINTKNSYCIVGAGLCLIITILSYLDLYSRPAAVKNNKLRCKKSLFKSTYCGNAFDSGKLYIPTHKNRLFIRIIDNQGNEFDFSIKPKSPYYTFSDYFED